MCVREERKLTILLRDRPDVQGYRAFLGSKVWHADLLFFFGSSFKSSSVGRFTGPGLAVGTVAGFTTTGCGMSAWLRPQSRRNCGRRHDLVEGVAVDWLRIWHVRSLSFSPYCSFVPDLMGCTSKHGYTVRQEKKKNHHSESLRIKLRKSNVLFH